MKKLKSYNATFASCCLSSVIQALGVNLTPLLFVSFQNEFSISLTKLTFLITITFTVQLLMDALSAKFIDKIGYRTAMISAHAFIVVGMLAMGILPYALPSAYAGLVIATIVVAIGCGILEVVSTPIVEAIPDMGQGKISLLHSCYCFGYVFTVLASVIYIKLFGRENWRYLMMFLAIVPLFNGIFFAFVPCSSLDEQKGKSYSLKELFCNKYLYLFGILIICAGASEQAMSQWISYFAEKGLGLDKTTGDVVGPLSFALLMGLGRLFYGLFGTKISIKKTLPFAGILCIATFTVAVVSSNDIISLIACAATGLAVSIMWPGTLDIAAKNIIRGGTALFALLALGGDIGCTVGPATVGFVSSISPFELKGGLGAAIVFPVIFFIASIILFKADKSHDYQRLLDEYKKENEISSQNTISEKNV